MRTVPTRCPLCSERLHVEKVRCDGCASAIEGAFGFDWFGALSADQLQFVKVFLVCRGKIKDVEQALGLSYPTVVSRLEAVVASLGETAPPTEARPEKSGPALSVLDQLAAGTIDVDEAERRLNKKK